MLVRHHKTFKEAARRIGRVTMPVVFLCTAVMASAGLTSTSSATQRAVLVLSSEAAPHREAARAYRERVEREGVRVTTVQFQALDDKLLGELLADSPGVITAVGTEAAASLSRRLPANVPLTYCMVADPASAGLTDEGSTYGVGIEVPLRDQFGLIADALPRTRTVGMLYQSRSPRSKALMEQARSALPHNWRLVAVSLSDHSSIADAVNALFRANIDVVWTAADSAVYDAATVRALLLASVRQKVPVFGFSSGFVRAGALLGVSIDPAEQGKQCAEITLQLFAAKRGSAASADAPQPPNLIPPHYRIEVNTVVAEMLGVRLPDSILRQAHQVPKPE